MTLARASNSTTEALRPARLLAICCLLLVFLPVLPQTASARTRATDDFDRANGGLGANWTSVQDGGLSISSHVVIGRNGLAGDIWTAGTFTSDQYSQIEVTATQLAGSQWIGAAVRTQNGGRDAYVGIYNWNGGHPELLLFRRSGGSWTQLGTGYPSGPLAAGTQLRVVAAGSTVSFLENGIQRLSVSDSSLSGGAPGMMIYGAGAAGAWSGGDVSRAAGFQVHYQRTDANGVRWYQVSSADNGPGLQVVRVLAPTHPARGVPHSFLYVLPVQPGLGNAYQDGLETLRGLDAQDQYNLTIIEPTFGTDPWYADNPKNPNVQYETFMTRELVPWAEKNLATTGREQNWLIGFSKSGLAAQDLILKHPGVFALAASWDFPADMSSYDQLGPDPAAAYGTDANFQANYRLTAAFMDAHKGPFLQENRIWIGGSREFRVAMSDYARLLTKAGIAYTRQPPESMRHQWGSGWVPVALAALRQDSIKLLQDQVNPLASGRVPPEDYARSIRWLYK
jgi:S-formylglutathione hydrolase FrmB